MLQALPGMMIVALLAATAPPDGLPSAPTSRAQASSARATRPADRAARGLIRPFAGLCADDFDAEACAGLVAALAGEPQITATLVVTGNGKEKPLGQQAFRGERTLDPGVTLDPVANEIRMPSGERRVYLEIKFEGTWDFDGAGRKLRSFTFEPDTAGYTSGLSGALTPCLDLCSPDGDGPIDNNPTCLAVHGGSCEFTGEPCQMNGDCPFQEEFDERCIPGSRCDFPIAEPFPQSCPTGSCWCEPGFFDKAREDYALPDGLVRAPFLGDLIGPPEAYTYADASVAGQDVFDPGPDGFYAGTLCLQVPADARGTFLIALDPRELVAHLVTDDPEESGITVLPVSVLIPARISLVCSKDPECDDGDPCTFDQCVDGNCTNEALDDELVCCNPDSGQLCDRPALDPPGDADGDGAVTVRDFSFLANCFALDPGTPACEAVETLCDCRIDLLDVAAFVGLLEGPVGP